VNLIDAGHVPESRVCAINLNLTCRIDWIGIQQMFRAGRFASFVLISAAFSEVPPPHSSILTWYHSSRQTAIMSGSQLKDTAKGVGDDKAIVVSTTDIGSLSMLLTSVCSRTRGYRSRIMCRKPPPKLPKDRWRLSDRLEIFWDVASIEPRLVWPS
jgi:hypothetical protein